MTNENSGFSPNKQALLKIRELKQQLADAQSVTDEPIAIVSMACRFPRTSDTPEKYWQSLIEKTDQVSDIPDDRWDQDAFHDDDPDVPGKMYARRGVFLEQIDQMDPEFFGISPREATWVDPQQRLLMEVGWEAIERAGWIPEAVGETTGVFVGWMHNDYQNEASDSFLNLNPYIATGAAGSFLCGRLAYYLGLQGPSVAVDTACSSSLVALHLAIQSLQQRDCDHALVGGVNTICSPTTNILTCKLKALSPNGHSRAFDAAADGYLRGEGCGVVTLRRLADAQASGDPILGIIRGSAIGHNGSGSGLTVPNPRAQQKVIQQALERANLQPEEVSYLEAHGTGTELGDPIELQAAAAALSGDRTADNPLLVGSVKTNVGHLEAAAGMAGLIKVLLSIQNGQIPGQLNFENPNPHIAWDDIPVRVLTDATAWPDSDSKIAGVSAFGMSGTNAHVIVEAPPVRATHPVQSAEKLTTRETTGNHNEPSPSLVTLSAKNQDALFALAGQYGQALQNDPTIKLQSFAATTNVARSHFQHRACVVANNREAVVKSLFELQRGSGSDNCFIGEHRRQPRVAWQFTGQGSQYLGMAKQLFETYDLFRETIEECDRELRQWRDGSLLSCLFDDDPTEDVNNTFWTQPAIFAIQKGLVQLLESWSLRPDVVFGHSVGQYAAACVAGVMSWSDGLRLISERGRLIADLPTGGCMVAVFANRQAVESVLAEEATVSLAATNGTHVVVSGDEAAIERIIAKLKEQSVRTKKLTTSHAFHSAQMDSILEPFKRFADSVSFQPPNMPLICNVSGEVLGAEVKLDGEYWAAHIRQPVRFAESIESLNGLGCEMVMELGPHPVLTGMAAANWKGESSSLFSCLRRGDDDCQTLLGAVAKAYTLGREPNFAKMLANPNFIPVPLPTYPFQRRRFWGPDKPRAYHAEYHTAHPLLGSEVPLAGAGDETRYQSFIDVDSPSWLQDHEVMSTTVFPGAGFIEMALQMAGTGSVKELKFAQPLRPSSRTALQTIIRKSAQSDEKDAATTRTMETYSSADNSGQWTKHFSANLISETSSVPERREIEQLRNELGEKETAEAFYQAMAGLGLNYGPAFQVIQELQFSKTEVLSRLSSDQDVRGYLMPPTILDGALHSLAVGLLRDDDAGLFLPVGIGNVTCYGPIEDEVWCHATWKQTEGDVRSADLVIINGSGQVLVELNDLQVKRINLEAMRRISGAGAERLVHEMSWKPARLANTSVTGKRFLLVDTKRGHEVTFVERMKAELEDRGNEVVAIRLVENGDFQVDSGRTTFCGANQEEWTKFIETLGSDFVDGVSWLAEDDQLVAGDGSYQTKAILAFVQSLLANGIRKIPCGLQLITTNATTIGAVEVESEESQYVNPSATQLWGLGRVLCSEQPEMRCRMLDLMRSELEQDETVGLAASMLLTETPDNQMAIRDRQWFAPRMTKVKLNRSPDPIECNSNGCYLVTGGLGMLGRQVAKWLAERGAAQIVLVSRRQPDEGAQSVIDAIAEQGTDVFVHSADMSSADDVANLFSKFGNEWNPLLGVVHAAGVLDDGLMESQSWDRFEKVLGPKIQASKLLHEFTKELPLELFVLYSSAASVLGSPGQSNYATGNAYLDGLAWQRQQMGLPAVSLNWGPWSAGMANDEKILKRMALQGITPLAVEESHQAMEKILDANLAQALVMDVDWRRMRIGAGGANGEVPAFLQDLVSSQKSLRVSESAMVAKLKKMKTSQQRELLVKTFQDSLQEILSTPDAPETDRPLIEMGLDSLMAVEFGTELQQMLGDQMDVGPTMLFDHPTIDSIADHVVTLISESNSQEEQGGATASKTNLKDENGTAIQREDIAIVGMSCRFPGAEDVDTFWQNLLNGVDSVRDIPNDRWDIDRFYSESREPGKMYTKSGGFLADIGHFDAAFFNISEQEACWLDPQHRMLLENSYRAMEDAGIATQPLTEKNVGVFMGIMGQDYAFLPTLDDEEVIQGFQGAGLSHSAGVGRISYTFGFEGPSVAVDTASSSSLVAVCQAMRSLQDGNCNIALAGGVNAILAPVNSLLMSKAGLLSPDGRCKSFSRSADGFGRGEGCGIVVLKRLSDAQKDGDRIMAVIRGGAVVHNGFSSSITSPSGKAQGRVITAALKDAELAPAEIQYLEAHGTGTEFGDPMELTSAMSIYGKGRKPDKPLLVGSVKANISHLEAAGGSSGLIKTVLAIHHGVIPQQIHCDEPSTHIPWQRMPAKIVNENTPWPTASTETEGDRLAGVTALGLVGTNAHLILGSPPKQATPTAETILQQEPATAAVDSSGSKPNLFVLSARSEQALREMANSYSKRLQSDATISIEDVCFTVTVGRRHFETRLALPFENRDDLITRLAQCGEAVAEFSTITTKPKLNWLFPDKIHSSQKRLRSLVDRFPIAKGFVQEFDQRLQDYCSSNGHPAWSIEQAIRTDETESQSALQESVMSYVVQACLAKLWIAWGIESDLAFGVGIGQYTASAVAGGICFSDALILIAERERIRQQSEPDWDAFETFADKFNFYPPNLPLVCSLSGELVPVHRSLGGSYWKEHVQAETATSDCMKTISEIEADACVVFGDARDFGDWATRFRQLETKAINCIAGDDPSADVLKSLGQLYSVGCNPDFVAVYENEQRNRLSLPPYPFQKKRYWITEIAQFMDEQKSKATELVNR